MELHIIKYLNEEIDSADVQIIIVCAALERARRMLVSALEEFDTAGPFLYIDDALGEIQVELNDVPTFERNWFMKERYLRIGSCFTQSAFNRRPTFVHQMIPSTSSLDGHSQNSEHSYDDLSEPSTELSIRISHREIHVHTGELITISSVVHSDDSEVDVKWYNGEKEISNSGRYRLSRKGWQFQLQIFDCDVIDQGEITCLAINKEDIAGEEPMFIEPLVFEQNGMNITLKCSVIGYPIPYVTFHRRNRRIPSDTHSVMQRDGELWTLKMDGCSVDDEGRYAAIARNRIGRAISHCKVTIAHKPPSSYIADV
uniref:Ig-like domain-containing protein n=1 Tax=Ascaris lumbricoides TaxID=6252 RepID=A0A9J2Q0S2_ASCLU